VRNRVPAATVLVVDDHPVVRRGLAAMLGLEDWVGRVVQAGSVREGAAVGATERADVAVVDLGLPTATASSWSACCAGPRAAPSW
jgi:DNA-binding NarL/FixJ family response regulator